MVESDFLKKLLLQIRQDWHPIFLKKKTNEDLKGNESFDYLIKGIKMRTVKSNMVGMEPNSYGDLTMNHIKHINIGNNKN